LVESALSDSQHGPDIRPEVVLALHHFAILAVNGLSIRVQFAHVAAVNLIEHIGNPVL
jgi:hypothetical protein